MAEAFGSPWAYSLRGWLAMLAPSMVVSVLHEAETPFPHFSLVLLSAVAQHCFAGLALLPFILLIRRRRSVLPLWAVFTSWTILGGARAVAGTAMVALFTDADINLPFRIVSWVLAAWAWMPLLSYAFGHNC
ncbi:MAG: hypothetical protein WED09_00930 [Homoserinimonas sp.]